MHRKDKCPAFCSQGSHSFMECDSQNQGGSGDRNAKHMSQKVRMGKQVAITRPSVLWDGLQQNQHRFFTPLRAVGLGQTLSCGLLGKITGNKPMAARTTPCTELIQEKPNKKSQRHHSANLHFQRNSCISRKSSSLFCVPQVSGSSCQHTDTGTFPSGGDVSAPSHSCQHRDTGTSLISCVKRKPLLDALLFPCPQAPKDVQHPEAHAERHSEMFSALRVVFHSLLSTAGGKVSTRRN